MEFLFHSRRLAPGPAREERAWDPGLRLPAPLLLLPPPSLCILLWLPPSQGAKELDLPVLRATHSDAADALYLPQVRETPASLQDMSLMSLGLGRIRLPILHPPF